MTDLDDYRLISLVAQRLDVVTRMFNQAAADGYKLVHMSDTVAAFFKPAATVTATPNAPVAPEPAE